MASGRSQTGHSTSRAGGTSAEARLREERIEDCGVLGDRAEVPRTGPTRKLASTRRVTVWRIRLIRAPRDRPRVWPEILNFSAPRVWTWRRWGQISAPGISSLSQSQQAARSAVCPLPVSAPPANDSREISPATWAQTAIGNYQRRRKSVGVSCGDDRVTRSDVQLGPASTTARNGSARCAVSGRGSFPMNTCTRRYS